MPQEPGGWVRTALANAMVGMKKQFYGRGPTAAKAWILDDYVFVAMEGGLTRNEETLLADAVTAHSRRRELIQPRTRRTAPGKRAPRLFPRAGDTSPGSR